MIKKLNTLVGGQLVAEVYAEANTTTLLVPNLGGNKNHGFTIEIVIKNASASTSKMQLCVNGDTTAANYYTATIYHTASIVVARYAGADICNGCSASAAFHSTGDLGRAFNGNFRAGLHTTYNSPSTTISGLIDQHVSVLGPVIAEITSIQITADVANAIAAGSYIRVWAKD